MPIPEYVIIGLLAAFALPFASSILSDRIDERRREMMSILKEIRRLYDSGKEYRHLPVRRVDYLRWEAYLFLFLSVSLMLLSFAGLYAAIEILQSQWWLRIGNLMDLGGSTITSARTMARGFVMIQLLRIWPFFVILMSLMSAYAMSINIRLVFPTAKRYFVATIKIRPGRKD